MAEALQKAQAAAAEAAKESLGGNPNKANAARAEARQALENAQQAVQAAAAQAAQQTPSGQPNAAGKNRWASWPPRRPNWPRIPRHRRLNR